MIYETYIKNTNNIYHYALLYIITEALLEHICMDGFDENGGLKWFTIICFKGEQHLYSVFHHCRILGDDNFFHNIIT